MPTRFNKTTIWVMIWAIWAIETKIWASNEPSIYETLESNGLPMGLLPKGVKDYKLSDTGKLEVHLEYPCSAKFESQLRYDRNVSGELSFGVIRNLTGVSAQDLFLWFPVKGIRVDVPSSGLIYFDVGVVYKQFSLSLFETPRDCVANGLLEKLKGIIRYPFINQGSEKSL